MENYNKNGSNWIFNKVESLDIHTTKYDPIGGSSYMELPKELYLKKAIINIKNKDNECFRWCLLRHLNPVKKNQELIYDLKEKKIASTLMELNFLSKQNIVSLEE